MSKYLTKFEPKKKGNPHNKNRRPRKIDHTNHFQSDDSSSSDSSSDGEYEEILIDTEVKPEVKPEDKPEVKPEVKQEVKPEVKPLPYVKPKEQKNYNNRPIIIKKTIKKYYKPKEQKLEQQKEQEKQETKKTEPQPLLQKSHSAHPQSDYLAFNPISNNVLLNRLKNF